MIPKNKEEYDEVDLQDLPNTYLTETDHHPITMEPAVLRENVGGGSAGVQSPASVVTPVLPEPVNDGKDNTGPIVDVRDRQSAFPAASYPRPSVSVSPNFERSHRERHQPAHLTEYVLGSP